MTRLRNAIYVDTETARLFSDVKREFPEARDRAEQIPLLGLTLACTDDGRRAESYWIHREGDLERLAAALDAAEHIVAYNASFDIGVMSGYFPERARAWAKKTHDLCQKLGEQEHEGSRYSSWNTLDQLLDANGLALKSQVGSDAPQMYRDGRYDELEEYCAYDVQGMKQLHGQDTIRYWRRLDYRTTYGRLLNNKWGGRLSAELCEFDNAAWNAEKNAGGGDGSGQQS